MNYSFTQEFENGLRQLDMLEPDSPEPSGLVFVDESQLDGHVYFALEKARKYKADAVYFRRFDRGRAPLPQIYVYDFTTRKEDEEEIAELHRKLWNSGQVPLFFIFTRTEVKIFNCLKSPIIDIDTGKIVSSPMETIQLVADIEKDLEKMREFSAKKFDNGSFWETSKYRKKFNLSDSSYETLLKYLKKIRDKAIKEKILEKPVIQKLLVMSILIKYLEEREDIDGKTVFPDDFFSGILGGAVCFTDILKEKGACLKLFDYLSRHFNGEIFKWNDEERNQLSQVDLTPFAKLFFEARTDITGQGTLWPLYSFNDLPIELISNIYEEFLGDKKGVVYTPPYLVHFLIDEAMPLKVPKENFKVLDPACGSGVFLVAAYRRIIDWWRIKNNWKVPDLKTLKRLLGNNIYGVDSDPEAVRLTIFSLCLALLDELSPKEIWDHLKFDDLKRSGNLYEEDFFKLILIQKLKYDFDLIIGNPPFIAELTTPSAKEIETVESKKRANSKKKVKIPDNQVALLFLEQAMTICKDNGLLCLILPSGPFLYNNNSFEFRKYFLQKYNVKQVLDFSALSSVLFGSANVATLAVFASKEEPCSPKILHVTVQRTKPSKEKIYFELDHYDFHYIPYDVAMNDKPTWKSNFLGGGRIHFITERLSSIKRRLGHYLNEKNENEGWVIGEGFILSDKKEIQKFENYKRKFDELSQEELKEYRKLKSKCKKANFLSGRETLPVEAFTDNGIDESKIHLLEERYFLRERKKEIYEGPHLLIKEGVGKTSIPISFRKEFLSFKNSIIGVHAPGEQINELLRIEKRIKNNQIYLFWVATYSGRYLVNKASSLLKSDIENLPYPEDEKDLELSEIENILVNDVLEYMLPFRRKGENSKAVKTVNKIQLDQFGKIYCKMLNAVYNEYKPYPPIIAGSFVCCPFYFGKKLNLKVEEPDKFENALAQLVHKKVGRNLRIARVLRIYDDNVIYLVKPNQVRYWLRSTAIRDADETFADLVKAGY